MKYVVNNDYIVCTCGFLLRHCGRADCWTKLSGQLLLRKRRTGLFGFFETSIAWSKRSLVS